MVGTAESGNNMCYQVSGGGGYISAVTGPHYCCE